MRRWSLLIGLFLASPLVRAIPVQIDAVRMVNTQESVRILLSLDRPVKFSTFELAQPARFVIDLPDARMRGALPSLKADQAITRVRTGDLPGGGVRLVLDMQSHLSCKVTTQDAHTDSAHRLVVDCERPKISSTLTEQPPHPLQRPENKTVMAPKVAEDTKKHFPKPEAAVKEPRGKSHSVHPTPSAKELSGSAVANKPKRRLEIHEPVGDRDILVMIDPGHGGIDVGAQGAAGTYEKDVVIDISRRLVKLINATPGMRAAMTRSGDHFVPLRKRMELARKHKADLFVSVHADAFNDERVQGSSVYTLSFGGATSEAARWLAERENSADLVGGISLDDKDSMLASVLLDLSQTATLEASLDVAGDVLREMKRIGNTHKRTVQQAGFVVLKSPDIPSILVETAYITNPDEEEKLKNPGHQDRMAKAVHRGITHYFRQRPPAGTLWAKRKEKGGMIAQTESAGKL